MEGLEGDDRGISAVLATVIAVVVVASLGAAAYSSLTRFRGDGDAPLAIALTGGTGRCGPRVSVAGVGEGAFWNDLALRVDHAPSSTIRVLDKTAANGTWRGAELDEARAIEAGDEIDIEVPQNATAAVLTVIDEPANALAARVPLAGLIHEPTHATCTYASDATPPPVGPNGTFDPGFAYEDPNNDFLYTEGLDIPIPNETIRRGWYTAAHDNGLVIPPSVGAISVGGRIDYRASGEGFVTIGIDVQGGSTATLRAGQDVRILNASVRSTGETVDVFGGRGIYANGASAWAKKTINLYSPSTIQINGTSLTSAEETINARTTSSGALYADGAVVAARKTINLGAEGAATRGPIHAEGARLTSTQETINLIAAGSEREFRLQSARLVAANAINLEGSILRVEGATFDDANNVARASSAGVVIVGTPAFGSVSAGG